MTLRAKFKLAIAAILLALSIWTALPSRNAFGNPSMEELVSSCLTASGTTVRLYVGSGTLTAFWYSVTADPGLLSREKQILFSYDGPELFGVSCANAQIRVTSSNGPIVLDESNLSALRESPRNYSHLDSGPGTWRTIGLAISAVLAATSIALLRSTRVRANTVS